MVPLIIICYTLSDEARWHLCSFPSCLHACHIKTCLIPKSCMLTNNKWLILDDGQTKADSHMTQLTWEFYVPVTRCCLCCHPHPPAPQCERLKISSEKSQRWIISKCSAQNECCTWSRCVSWGLLFKGCEAPPFLQEVKALLQRTETGSSTQNTA